MTFVQDALVGIGIPSIPQRPTFSFSGVVVGEENSLQAAEAVVTVRVEQVVVLEAWRWKSVRRILAKKAASKPSSRASWSRGSDV